MKFIVDANVLSEAMRPAPSAVVIDWLRANERELAVTPIILGEIEYGILLLPEGRRKRLLRDWFANRIRTLVSLDFDTKTASAWAELLARLKRRATPMAIKDSLIAASALRHGFAIATRNVDDFSRSGATLVNPFDR